MKNWHQAASSAGILTFLISATLWAQATAPAAAPATPPGPVTLATGWTQLKEGDAVGSIEADAVHPTNPAPHLLKITETKAADPGKGRLGATNSTTIKVEDGAWYDITFSGAIDRSPYNNAGIGLVFSLETADGKVLARTTLPEIGRGGGGGRRGGGGGGAGGAAGGGAAWPNYLVSLHARGSDSAAHLTITPIEPITVWLNGITLTPRIAAN